MSIAQALLPEYDHEMANTRKFLERVPDDRLDWRPHQKSFTVAQLGTHLANLPSWVAMTINTEELDVAPPGEPPYKEDPKKSHAEMLEAFDKNVKEGREALAGVSDQSLMVSWKLLAGGKTVLSMPRVAVLRGFVMNHNVHHRAQLGVYLRLCDIPVPAVYGPSADDSAGM
jgi:uncharacterized damage-inducible protein DinB